MKSKINICVPKEIITNKHYNSIYTHLYTHIYSLSNGNYKAKVPIQDLISIIQSSDITTLDNYISSIPYLTYHIENLKSIEFNLLFLDQPFTTINKTTYRRLLGAVEKTKYNPAILIRLYLLYKLYNNSDFGYCWIPMNQTAEILSVSRKTVFTYNQILEENGFIEKIVSETKGSNKYYIL